MWQEARDSLRDLRVLLRVDRLGALAEGGWQELLLPKGKELNTMSCKGCEFEAFVKADQSFDAGEFSGSFDYGDSPEHTCEGWIEIDGPTPAPPPTTHVKENA